MFKKIAYFAGAAVTAVGTLALGPFAHAAADSDVLTAASTTVSTLKDNIIGVITANIGTIAIVAAAIVGIMVVYRLLRRMVGR